jgi:hypothetical protein
MNLDHWTDEELKRLHDAMMGKVAQRAASNKTFGDGTIESTTNYPFLKLIDDPEEQRRVAEEDMAEYRKGIVRPQAQQPVPNLNPVFDIGQLEGIEFYPFPKRVDEEEIAKRLAQCEAHRERGERLEQQYKLEAEKVSLFVKSPLLECVMSSDC